MLDFLRQWVLGLVTESILTPEFREQLVKTVNENVDLPNLNEQQEAELIDSVAKALFTVIKGQLSRLS